MTEIVLLIVSVVLLVVAILYANEWDRRTAAEQELRICELCRLATLARLRMAMDKTSDGGKDTD